MPRKPKPIADQLRAAIANAEKRGITRYQIAQLSGVSQQNIANIVNGSTPRVDIAERIADAIGFRLILQKN